MASIIVMSMREHQGMLYYLGFMRGKISKTLFFLFCGALVFPMDGGKYLLPEGESDSSWVNWFAGAFLTACSITQLVKYCRKDEDTGDRNKSEPMMETSMGGASHG